MISNKAAVLLVIICHIGWTYAVGDIGDPCTKKEDCLGNKICYDQGGTKCCFCPIGYKGADCREVDFVDAVCPYPDSPVGVCTVPPTGQPCGFDNSDCPDNGICCISSDGCGSQCISASTGCGDPANVKTCTDDGKLCVNDGMTIEGFRCECPVGYTGTDCRTRDFVDKDCKYPSVKDNICESLDEPVCLANSECGNREKCCSTGCGTECRKKGILNPHVLLLAYFLQNQRRSARPPVRPPAPGCPRRCGVVLCDQNLRATCRPTAPNGCNGNFYDQHTGRLVTSTCFCQPGVTPIMNCSPNSCFDRSGRPLICSNNPSAKCRVSRCGSCYRYWRDDQGRGIYCERELSSPPPSSVCAPGERVIPCPNLCGSVTCTAYPSAICSVHPCNGCRFKFMLGTTDVTSQCNIVG